MEEVSSMYIASRAFKNGGRIPPQYTQDGQGAKSNSSPPLEWYNVPEEAKCLALIVEDPEPMVENSPTSFCHWIVLNIPPTLKGLPENFSMKEHDDDHDELTQIREGVNDFKVPSYRGPNPPTGEHNYEFHLYALSEFPKVPKKPNKDRLLEAMQDYILEEAVLVGHYNKENYGTENVKGFTPTGQSQHSGPGRAHLKGQHHNTKMSGHAHQ
jgi:Raf kinase inhibitor-like YbhB/YbcL family protein